MDYNFNLTLGEQIKNLKLKNLTGNTLPNYYMHKQILDIVLNKQYSFNGMKQKYLQSAPKYFDYLDDNLTIDQKNNYFHLIHIKYNEILNLFNKWEQIKLDNNNPFYSRFIDFLENQHLLN